MIQLRPGLRLRSTAGEAEVVVVRGTGEVDLRCGGVPMTSVDSAGGAPTRSRAAATTPEQGDGDGTLLGKRYAHEPSGTEVLCTKPGTGALSVGSDPLVVRAAKPLPASD